MCVSVPQVDAVVGEEEEECVDQLRLFKPQGHQHSHQLVQTVCVCVWCGVHLWGKHDQHSDNVCVVWSVELRVNE